MQISADKQYISLGQYRYITGEINEAGKMVGGWIRSCKEPATGKSPFFLLKICTPRTKTGLCFHKNGGVLFLRLSCGIPVV